SYEEKLNTLIGKMIGDWNFTAYYYDSRRAIKSRETWVPMIILMGISTFLILNVSLGLFGVLWQNIQKRRPEIGLRQATGATRQKIYIQFILEMVLMASMGIFLGLLIAIQFPLLKVIDIGNDIFFKAMATAALIIYVLVVLCSYYPSRQASLIQPAKVLHEE
ncbi:MAG: FtsX-like permease family protein, partial [Saprospiraceae bacterium]|nr:FtsX-like permease family protein [Saprospiraceae bacterium]